MRPLRALIRLLEPRDRRRLGLIGLGLLAAAATELVGVASVVPFLTLVGDPGAAARIPLLAALRDGIGAPDERGFLLAAGFAALAAIAVSTATNAAVTYAQLLFTNLVGFRLSRRLLARYLARDRLFFARANSAELAKNVLAETDRLVVGVLTPASVLVTRLLTAVAIVAFLIAYEPRLALILGAGFGSLYVALFLVVRRRLAVLGARASRGNEARFRVVAECFGALTELRLYGRVRSFAAAYDAPAESLARATAAGLLIGQMPRFAIEALAFGGVIAVVLYALGRGGDTAGLLPLLGLFAFSGYRLLPAFQNIFLAVAQIRYNLPAARIVAGELAGERPDPPRPAARLPFRDAIRLERVAFAYGDEAPVLRGIDLAIPAHRTVGFVGRTGSGKSTLIGLILGVLRPTAGRITVDGVALDAATLPLWQNRIGYVPQDVFLIDDSVSANIALGVPAAEIDPAAVERAARIAEVHDVIAALPEGYATRVGERGTRLSGGQRQRLGIARALYHDPDVIVFDEATSALDQETEAAVMTAIDRLAGTRTILMIAHRLASLHRADIVHVLEGGRVVASGSLAEVAPQLGPARTEEGDVR
ncbi:ABC transporter ATP-binding protein [Methylobacterium oryzihabitans]|uniref:ABC transporter ATP-binding protein n=1 Tax=Methylobacterium oryzihabitans TaxID=2499852 RepID=A0A437P069_9HYPH|nr:ABC transporter ATP-binding protein [Methylobacterium oryzihabitans]RVU15653.1 ABC transporter ATP-binding protein [Methylobacterium oryzihabitans]